MSDTPRTDVFCETTFNYSIYKIEDFARQLERELSEARQLIEDLKFDLGMITSALKGRQQ